MCCKLLASTLGAQPKIPQRRENWHCDHALQDFPRSLFGIYHRPDLGRGKRARDGGALPHRASPPSTVLSTVTGRRYVKVAQLLLSTKPPSGRTSANRELVVVTAQGVPSHDIQVM